MNFNMKIRLTESKLKQIVNESVRNILKENFDRAAFENACDDLYYGYGFEQWRKDHDYLDPVTADKIWHAAFKKVSGDSDAEFVPHSIESYDYITKLNNEKFNVQPDENGRYPHENLNVLDGDGKKGLWAQGGGNNKLGGYRAIMDGGKGLADAAAEYNRNFDSINNSRKAKEAWKQGRIGNERPLHRKGSANRDLMSINK